MKKEEVKKDNINLVYNQTRSNDLAFWTIKHVLRKQLKQWRKQSFDDRFTQTYETIENKFISQGEDDLIILFSYAICPIALVSLQNIHPWIMNEKRGWSVILKSNWGRDTIFLYSFSNIPGSSFLCLL